MQPIGLWLSSNHGKPPPSGLATSEGVQVPSGVPPAAERSPLMAIIGFGGSSFPAFKWVYEPIVRDARPSMTPHGIMDHK